MSSINEDKQAADYISKIKTKDELAMLVVILEKRLSNIRSIWPSLSSDIEALFEQQPMNKEDGSYKVDGQSANEMQISIFESGLLVGGGNDEQ